MFVLKNNIYFEGKEANWVNQASTYGRSQLSLESARPEDSGNYTCLPSNAENDTVIVHVLEGLGEPDSLYTS